jgi:hypothetical protein
MRQDFDASIPSTTPTWAILAGELRQSPTLSVTGADQDMNSLLLA